MVLHRYTKAKRGLSYLKDGLLRFSPLPEFNDPFEMRPYLDSLGTPEQEEALMDEVEEELGKLPPGAREELMQSMRIDGLAEIRARMVREFEATVGILCLVDNRRHDLLMWAHYADSHRGCVLEFDDSHEWFHSKHGKNPHSLMGVLQRVKYHPSRPAGSVLGVGQDHFLTKAECWSYEREARILLNLQDCETQVHDGKEVKGLFPVDREALANVYLGVNVDAHDREQFLELLPPGHRVGLFQFRLDESEFALVARQVN